MRNARALRSARSATRNLLYLQGLSLAAAALLAGGCATPQAGAGASTTAEVSAAPVLTEEGQRYLENVYLFMCAPEYIPYPEGQGPTVPGRSDAERQARREDLAACRDRVERRYTTLDSVRALTWNGSTHTMTDAEMRGIVRDGPSYLEDYVDELLQRERSQQFAGTVAGETSGP